MNVFNNYNNKIKNGLAPKKAKSSNRVPKDKLQLPSLKVAINKDNKFNRNGYLEIINQNIGKKKNHSQLHYQIQKNHKPYSGNPLKFHNKKELNNFGGNKFYPEREIFTANPYLVGYNGKKKNNFRKNNNNINELYNKYLIYPAHNNIIKNKKDFNHTKKIINNNNKNIQNNIKKDNNNNIIIYEQNAFSNAAILNSNTKLRAQYKNNNQNKIVIIANNKSNKEEIKSFKTNSNNNNSDDMKKTITSEKEISIQENEDNNTNYHEHLDLCFVSYAYSENPNLEHRKEMEDFHYIKALLNKKLSCSYFGLFDGHSGKEVGLYLMENLHKIISQELKNNIIENSENMKNIIKNSFEKIDKEINNQNFKNETGSTGTVLLLYKDNNSKTGKSLICANVGDSRAYLINKKEIKIITKDHKCCDANEVKRIRDTGGIVFGERVFGTLMLTRSFGDKEMKKYGVLSTPDIFYHNIDEDDLFAIIASDGVWDVIEEDEIFKLSQDKISSNDFSNKIIQLAKERDTHDNISCIVVKLNKNN